MASNVVVVGSVNVDMVFRVPRLPSPGETVTGGTFDRGPGGKGGNQAAAAARLGARTWFVGLVGPDDLGRDAREDLEAVGVDVRLLGTGRSHTGAAGIFVDQAGENMIAVASGANAELGGDAVREALAGIEIGHAVVVANLEIPDDAVVAAAEVAEERGWTFVLNPAPARPVAEHLLARCGVVVPNEVEVAALGTVQGMLEAGAGSVVVTRGRDGADLHRPDRPVHRQQGFDVEVVDTTGAGDAFCAAMAHALGEGRDLTDAVRYGAAAGALACEAEGARGGLPTVEDVERLIGTRPSSLDR